MATTDVYLELYADENCNISVKLHYATHKRNEMVEIKKRKREGTRMCSPSLRGGEADDLKAYDSTWTNGKYENLAGKETNQWLFRSKKKMLSVSQIGGRKEFNVTNEQYNIIEEDCITNWLHDFATLLQAVQIDFLFVNWFSYFWSFFFSKYTSFFASAAPFSFSSIVLLIVRLLYNVVCWFHFNHFGKT